MKILVTGDRNWDDIETVYNILKEFPAGTILIHGAARGADTIAAVIGEELGFDCRPYPYLKAYGKAGGPKRNTQMAQENPDIEQVIGFHNNISESRGTKDMMYRATPEHLPNATVRLITSPKPSEFAKELFEKMKVAANEEVQKRLENGRSIVGIHNGEIITIKPKTKNEV